MKVKEQQGKAKNLTLISAGAGLISSAVGKAILHPIDTIKAKL